MSLRKNQAALQTGQSGRGEPRGIRVRAEFPRGDHRLESSADAGFPAVIARGQDSTDGGVAFADLTEKVRDRAPAPSTSFFFRGWNNLR